jgi:uncharacterized membrane protein
MLAGVAIGAGTGAVAGHMAGGIKWSDLKDLGELLDQGTSRGKRIQCVITG